MRDLLPSLIIILTFFGAIAGAHVLEHRRAKAMLLGWAVRNTYEIVGAQRPLIKISPFGWTTSKGQVLFKVVVRKRIRDGVTRSGWVRCGGFWTGLWSDDVEVRWDDEPAPVERWRAR